MRKAINIFTLLFFIWLVLDAFHVLDALLGFILVGAIPGTSLNVSPTLMLTFSSLAGAYVIFEVLSRHINSLRRIRQHLIAIALRRERLPLRRFSRTA